MNSDGKSSRRLERRWKYALKKRVCPFAKCDLSKGTCEHLDNYLNFGRHIYEGEVPLIYTEDIDRFGGSGATPQDGAWAMFKTLRKYGIANDQIQILVRKFAYDMSHRQIMAELGWLSFKTFDRRYHEALAALKHRGFGQKAGS